MKKEYNNFLPYRNSKLFSTCLLKRLKEFFFRKDSIFKKFFPFHALLLSKFKTFLHLFIKPIKGIPLSKRFDF